MADVANEQGDDDDEEETGLGEGPYEAKVGIGVGSTVVHPARAITIPGQKNKRKFVVVKAEFTVGEKWLRDLTGLMGVRKLPQDNILSEMIQALNQKKGNRTRTMRLVDTRGQPLSEIISITVRGLELSVLSSPWPLYFEMTTTNINFIGNAMREDALNTDGPRFDVKKVVKPSYGSTSELDTDTQRSSEHKSAIKSEALANFRINVHPPLFQVSENNTND